MNEEILSQIRYDSRGLVPAVVQDAETKEVLMLAYMNEEALKRTLTSGTTWFYSRSRQAMWNKGETSGHFQMVKESATTATAIRFWWWRSRSERRVIPEISPVFTGILNWKIQRNKEDGRSERKYGFFRTQRRKTRLFRKISMEEMSITGAER